MNLPGYCNTFIFMNLPQSMIKMQSLSLANSQSIPGIFWLLYMYLVPSRHLVALLAVIKLCSSCLGLIIIIFRIIQLLFEMNEHILFDFHLLGSIEFLLHILSGSNLLICNFNTSYKVVEVNFHTFLHCKAMEMREKSLDICCFQHHNDHEVTF